MTDPSAPPALAGLRVFVVDDEPLVGMLLEDMLDDLGCVCAGSAMRVDQALATLAEPGFGADVAILDVNVAGASILPVAQAARAAGMAVVFATGYGESGLPEPFRDSPILQKPFGFTEVSACLQTASGR